MKNLKDKVKDESIFGLKIINSKSVGFFPLDRRESVSNTELPKEIR